MGLSAIRFLFLAVGISAIAAAASRRSVTLDDVTTPAATLAGRASAAITWSPDGRRFIVNEDRRLSLYEVKSGKSREVLAMAKLEGAAVKPTLSGDPAPFGWENRNLSEKPIQWFPDNRHLLIAAGGDLFEVDAEKSSFEPLTQTAEAERDPKLSPDGLLVSFRRGHDLQVLDLATKEVRALTANGTSTLLNGEADWVYPEELALETAYWWSPDSKSIAYMQFDTSHEPLFPHAALLSTRAVPEPERYPKAGDPNAEVRLGVVAAAGGQTKWMDLGEPRDNLLARVVWSPNSRDILAQRLNRVQNKLDLFLANAATGSSKIILHEEDPKWMNAKSTPLFTAADRFLFLSERSGFFHLYLYGTDGELRKQLTSGNWEVDKLVSANATRAFFTSTENSPLERQLYSISLDGTDKRQLTAGEGTHNISIASGQELFMDDYSAVNLPPRSTLRASAGADIRVFRAPNDAPEYELQPVRLLTIRTKDGTELHARMIQPPNFQPTTKYPAIVMVYGGPGSQQIHNAWTGATWEQVLASKGFVVWQLDNRGSTGRGHAFEAPIYHALGKQELADQREGIEYLLSQGYVDAKRIGMYGWSYGGFMTLYTATNAPGLLKAAIAGAPVTNWRNYDSIYTERYMGLPADDPEAYRLTSPQTKAGDMQGTKLLMIHNIEDDNVHFQNSMQMANAFEQAGVQFYMLLYPGKSHGVTGQGRKHLLEETTQFFEDNLK